MAESVRSPFDYREPPTLDSDGDGSRPPPSRGQVCVRKRKGFPVKVCERPEYGTEDEEESLSEHSYSPGDDHFAEGAEDRIPAQENPYFISEPQLCIADLSEEGSSGAARTPVLFHPPPNCRIREVHCGSQIRLVVIAIRDIAKGEEITVDYSLSDWGENTMGFHNSVSPRGFECGFNPENTIKKEENPLSLNASDYLTPSWSLSPSSSPLTHSEPSDSDQEEEDDEEEDDEEDEEELEDIQGPMLRQRKKRKASTSTKKKTPPHPFSFTSPSLSSGPTFQQPLAPPTTNINNNININIGHTASRQHCPYCGRHFRSLARHLEKHHEQQPEVRAAMELAHATTSHHAFSTPAPPSTSLGSSLFPRERDLPKSTAVSFSLSVSPSQSNMKTSLTTTRKFGSKIVTHCTPPPARRGRPPKKAKELLQRKKTEDMEEVKEVATTPGKQEEKEKMRENIVETNGKTSGASRSHVSPLLSSLSTLVFYLRRLQQMSFISLSQSSSSSVDSWRQLCHSSLALLILYNRHRECEVAKLTIQDYHKRCSGTKALDASLSRFELHMLGHLPRVSVLGKRGRLQPLILPPHSEASLDLLIKMSGDAGVDPQSPYVFSRQYHSPATPLRGIDLLRSLGRSCGANNPSMLTAQRVRQQVAILTQLLLLDEGEPLRNLEDFLQREYHVNQSCTGIGQDLAMMDRVGRVVLYGEKDGVQFRGTSLQNICLELDLISGHTGDSFSDDSGSEERRKKEDAIKKSRVTETSQEKKILVEPSINPPPSAGPKKASTQPKTGKRGVLKRPWSEEERIAVETHLLPKIESLCVPAKAECERALKLCPILRQRDWRAIKFYCHNRIQLLKKRRSKNMQ